MFGYYIFGVHRVRLEYRCRIRASIALGNKRLEKEIDVPCRPTVALTSMVFRHLVFIVVHFKIKNGYGSRKKGKEVISFIDLRTITVNKLIQNKFYILYFYNIYIDTFI